MASGLIQFAFVLASGIINIMPNESYVGRLEPVDPERGLQRYNRGASLIYRVFFPVTSPLPHLTSLTVNGQELCYGPADVPGPNQYVSTISLQHMLYLRGGSNSVFYPGDRPGGLVKPDTSIISNNLGEPEVFYNNDGTSYFTFFVNKNSHRETVSPSRPIQTFDSYYYPAYTTTTQRYYYPDYYSTERKHRPWSPNYYPDQPSDFDQYATQRPTRPPRPRPSSDLNPYTTEQAPRPPVDYNPYATERPPQPPSDFNPYATQRPQWQQPQPPPAPPATSRPPATEFPSRVECGIVAGNEKVPLVQNGQHFERGEWPWLVAVYKRTAGGLSFKCGGTLVSDKHIVTAAHCMRLRGSFTSMQDIVIKLGVYNLEDWSDDQTITRTLQSATIHESYNVSSLANDILVFTMDKSVQFSTNIRPACLWSGNPDLNRIVGAAGVVAGWGNSELGPAGKGEPRMVRLPIVSTSTCRASKPDFHKLTSDTTLCAGDRNGAGPCLGDSGGGLYVLDGGRWRLRGIVSLSLQPESGEKTCDLEQYIIFTDAAKYLTWIRSIIQSSQF
ncbi:hypothetical protein ACJJTC_018088 [Scirpophaga incertulas]